MADHLTGMRIAILATDGVERIELEQPRGALYGAGAASDLLSIHSGEIQARQFDMVSAGTFPVDRLVTDSSAGDYDAMLPGGTVNPDTLRINADAVGFVRACRAGIVDSAGSAPAHPGPAAGFTFNVKAFSLLTQHPTRPAALYKALRERAGEQRTTSSSASAAATRSGSAWSSGTEPG